MFQRTTSYCVGGQSVFFTGRGTVYLALLAVYGEVNALVMPFFHHLLSSCTVFSEPGEGFATLPRACDPNWTLVCRVRYEACVTGTFRVAKRCSFFFQNESTLPFPPSHGNEIEFAKR